MKQIGWMLGWRYGRWPKMTYDFFPDTRPDGTVASYGYFDRHGVLHENLDAGCRAQLELDDLANGTEKAGGLVVHSVCFPVHAPEGFDAADDI